MKRYTQWKQSELERFVSNGTLTQVELRMDACGWLNLEFYRGSELIGTGFVQQDTEIWNIIRELCVSEDSQLPSTYHAYRWLSAGWAMSEYISSEYAEALMSEG